MGEAKKARQEIERPRTKRKGADLGQLDASCACTTNQRMQGYRVQVHDEFLDATTCGDDKKSPNRKRPHFHRGPLQMIGWLAALVYNACADLAAGLGADWEDVFVRTLRGTFFQRPGNLYCTPTALIVCFEREFSEQTQLLPTIDRINAEQHRIPWLDNRLLVLSVCPAAKSRAGP